MVHEAANVPVELEIEKQKILKIEIELQELLLNIENGSLTKEEFDHYVLSARSTLSNLKKTFSRFEDAVQECEDHESFTEKIIPLVASHKNVIQSLQTSFQKACITGQKQLSVLEKTELLKSEPGAKNANVRQRKLEKVELENKAEDVTKNLANLARIMDMQVKQGEESNVMLEQSSQQIKETHDEYKGLTGIISVARKLLNKYNRRELTDTLLIFFGLILFFATVLYIISKRI